MKFCSAEISEEFILIYLAGDDELDPLTFFLNGPAPLFVAFVEKRISSLVLDSLELIVKNESEFITFLTTRDFLPKISAYDNGEVKSFVCSGSFCKDIFGNAEKVPHEKLAYKAMELLYNMEIKPASIKVCQVPCTEYKTQKMPDIHYNVIIPHHGDLLDLKVCLSALERSNYQNFSTFVCFDSELTNTELEEVKSINPRGFFSSINPPQAGPYIIRQKLIETLADGFILFQDSDDISTSDRMTELHDLLLQGYDLVGSHELRFDEISQTLRAIRYPLDVIEALNVKPAFPMLHSTGALSVGNFNKVGGYSTNRKFSNDSQFLLRSFFFLKIANVDEFLYIRKVHKNSLTNSKVFPLGGEIREQLGKVWMSDFTEVKAKSKELNDTSLKTIRVDGYSLENK